MRGRLCHSSPGVMTLRSVSQPRHRCLSCLRKSMRLKREFQSHLSISQHNVSFCNHSEQLLFVATGDNGKVREMEFAHAFHHFMHCLVGKSALHIAGVDGRYLDVATLATLDLSD